MPLVNCEMNLILTWSANCAICKMDREITFTITDTKRHVPEACLREYKTTTKTEIRIQTHN